MFLQNSLSHIFDRFWKRLSRALPNHCGPKRHGEKKSVDFYDEKILLIEVQIILSTFMIKKPPKQWKGHFAWFLWLHFWANLLLRDMSISNKKVFKFIEMKPFIYLFIFFARFQTFPSILRMVVSFHYE